jgi:hypothetical protein
MPRKTERLCRGDLKLSKHRHFHQIDGQIMVLWLLVGRAMRTGKHDVPNAPPQMCLRLARSVKRKASRHPSTAPIMTSQFVLLSNDRLPLPAIRKPQYAIAKVQGIMRRMLIGTTSPYGNTDTFFREG